MLPFAASAETSIPEGFTPIYTIEDLDDIRNNPNGKYILMKDLDLAGINWTPIGGTFTGVFDGNGHVIKNLTIIGNGGLFAGIGYFAVIQNLGIVDCMIDGGDTAGGMACSAPWGVAFKNCFVTGTIAASISAGGFMEVLDTS